MIPRPISPTSSLTVPHVAAGPRRRQRLPAGVALLAGAAAVLFLAFWLLDWVATPSGARPAGGPFHALFALDLETMQNALGSLAQVIVAVLGIAITVVSIVVQLAATRHTPRIADMFFRDRTNLAIMGFFVVACIDAVWVSLAVGGGYVPRATVMMTVVVVTGSLLLLVPYFAYVFRFLDPERIIVRIAEQTLDTIFRETQDVGTRQAAATASIEHLADVAVNALAQKDQVIACHALGTLRRLFVRYLSGKNELPAAWFTLGARVRGNPDFIAQAADSVAEIERERVWLEWKVLRHLRGAFSESLKHLPEMAHVVAIETRYAGEAALSTQDSPVTELVIKHFNTLMRSGLNSRDVRACYNILHQYRQLAEHTIADGRDELATEIGRHLVYYGQTAHGLGLGFVTETAAYDLGALCERAFAHGAGCHDALLRAFLEIDKEADTTAEERTLRGVRKAQAKLATFYLLRGAEPAARRIQQDMATERADRLASIRDELMAVKSRDFWEVTDRGINFDYLDEPRRKALDEFFAWFGSAKPAAAPAAPSPASPAPAARNDRGA